MKRAIYKKKKSSLNLVALMDIFTVLVFFLIFNVHEDQAVALKNTLNVPRTLLTIDEIKSDKSIDILEIISEKEIYFKEKRMQISKILPYMSKFCSKRKNSCENLDIIASEKLNYSLIDKYVKLGERSGFIHVNLILKYDT